MSDINALRAALNKASSKTDAKSAAVFFKTGPGQYGEGDIFIGIRAPALRKIAQQHNDLPLEDINLCAASKIHEERMAGLFILVNRYKNRNTTPQQKKEIYDFYMAHTHGINNWDLVDISAPSIPGDYLFDKDRSILIDFAHSDNLWKRRIAIIATQEFIRRGDYAATLDIADILINDTHDLIHKAVGWMLREIGKRDIKTEKNFLRSRYKTMPRTMLRYAIEKFPESERKKYLKGEI